MKTKKFSIVLVLLSQLAVFGFGQELITTISFGTGSLRNYSCK